jgi:hypothetical protein
MSGKGSKRMFGLLAGLLVPMAASASTVIVSQRCTNDSLDINQATQRIEWARRCGIQAGAPSLFDTYMLAAPNYTSNLYDYLETAYYKFSGDSWGNEVNSTHVNSLYLSGPTSQSIDSVGYRWARTSDRIRPRPYYPTFGTSPDINSGIQLYPHPTLANCQLYSDPYGQNPAYAYYVNGYCTASCYTPEQKVLFSDGEQVISEAFGQLRTDLVTLGEQSTLDDIQLKPNRTAAYTRELRNAEHKVVEISTASGGFLRVTDEHPVVQGDGRIVQAHTLKVGEELVKADGTRDQITQVNKTTFYGLVYNLRPETTDRVSNVLVAQGFLVGSSVFQNDDIGYINRRILFRSSLPAHVIP